ncbi:asparagine synthase (glutamine-hydrolyzing) [Oleiagrimonas sp.]|jgi:asparagine synthase (glutamine-hydrolysing)|uniref:asparagine synthase (glutamine-hydrolyzing) n=1 Tax=Oleiagrimonas sp. TaxID=2010330 RepID=UPI002620CA8F|nr:asparagine synthase (glutamine-hydrolyzing) [Oleiagrimonas sp.]MDA3913723.1 asparagine synthase (glutamine-hydrolyzing) [Oleiagrimonas sp.]
MCGICGALALDGQTEVRDLRESTRTMLAAMTHRGPHGEAMLSRRNAAIGANRLAIRSVQDHQPPLLENDAGIIVACNGEIDNHRELRAWLEQRGHNIARTTDVAVIPALYLELGSGFVEKLEGVFAIAIWDPRKQSLLLTRDRVGERHLLYAKRGNTLHFASELSALVAGRAGPLELAPEAIRQYLRAGYFPAPELPLKDHAKVRPGEIVTFDKQGLTRTRYWNCPIGKTKTVRSTPRDFDKVFRDAVYRQSDMDVEHGVLLSGGVDSSLITAVARSVRPDRPLTTYGIRFQETSFDEGDVASRVAQMLDCDYVPVTVTSKDFPETLRDLIAATGEPLADPAWIPLSVVAQRAAQDVRVVLAGEGADELFGGYPTYLGARFADRYMRLPASIRSALRQGVERLPVSDKKVTVSFLLKRFMQGLTLPGLARHMSWTANIQPEVLHRLGIDVQLDPPSHPGMALLDEVQRFDFRNALPEALMAKADRGGMRHALEIRAPFLDHTVIDFASRLPERARVHGLTTKVFLKRYALQYLPRSVVHRRKRGLSVPLASWLREPLHDWAQDRLSSHALEDAGISTQGALELLRDHRARKSDHARALWTLIVLSEWLDWAAQHATQAPLQRKATADDSIQSEDSGH